MVEITADEQKLIATIVASAIEHFPGSVAKVSRVDGGGWRLLVQDGALEHRIAAATLTALLLLELTAGRERSRVQDWRPI